MAMATSQVKGSGWPRRASNSSFEGKVVQNQSVTINRTVNLKDHRPPTSPVTADTR